ncbi:UDP-N-acetylmuramoyl-tripeptide--D-alanyl-D-alanine ligase [Leeuwenhoekiella sp. A16]|uniref:UDP-N-acetylmuramoyl-tripeptide--D-alanyl-D- alanine ligase n=1 Tax=unclassified Leeuwenhoekiella TaxID=2615029 RepID=UPI003A80AC5A
MNIQDLHSLFLKSTGVSTDTRKIETGNIFFALKGENFNGNIYANKALEAGAAWAIVDEKEYAQNDRTVLVDDCLKTLQNLAKHHRNRLKTPIIALTGSNGKTTTKELINAVLSQKFSTVSTLGNLNNHIGVPLTLLRLTQKTEIGIIEMGANHLKEIEQLAEIAAPDYGYITNFGKAHLEGFGSKEGVIKGKSELYAYLKSNNKTLFINSDDPIQLKETYSNTFTFGTKAGNDIVIKYVDANPYAAIDVKSHLIESNLIGSYNATNIAAAVAIGNYFEVPAEAIHKAIAEYTPTNNRSQIIQKGNNTIILDAYNANPTSMQAALQNFAKLKSGYKTVILGDMFELGSAAEEEHEAIVELAISMNFDKIILLGSNFYKVQKTASNMEKYDTYTDFSSRVNKETLIKNSGHILIKGSRGMALERVLDLL